MQSGLFTRLGEHSNVGSESGKRATTTLRHLRPSPFRTFRQTFQGGFVVDTFVEMFEMEMVEKKGD